MQHGRHIQKLRVVVGLATARDGLGVHGAAQHVLEQQRLRHAARRLLETTALSLEDISTRTGLGASSTLWRAFTRLLGVAPAEYRRPLRRPPTQPLTLSA